MNLHFYLSLLRKGDMMIDAYRDEIMPNIIKVHHIEKAIKIDLSMEGDEPLTDYMIGYVDMICDFKVTDAKLAEKLGVSSSVIFTGYISMEEKVNWMRRSHVIVNPSPKEGWGLTNIEANACGTPAVASDADGLRDSVNNGETGLLFPYGNHKILAEQVIRILSDNELRERLTRNAITWAQNFTWDECALKTMKVVEEIFGDSSGNRKKE